MSDCLVENNALAKHSGPLPDLDSFGATDIGQRRKSNQDHFLIANLQRVMSVQLSSIPEADREQYFGLQPGYLLLVADGMGGYEGGEKASCSAVQTVSCYILDMMQWFLRLSQDAEDDFLDELKLSLNRAQENIGRQAVGRENEMGTTVTLAYVIGTRMYIVHAGDSRCYLLRDGELRRLTTDHTIAQKLVDKGALSADEAETSRWNHVLWNCVGGSGDPVRAEVSRSDLCPGDQILLCTDGLYDHLTDDQVLDVLNQATSCQQAVQRLIDQANQSGGSDNITAIVSKVPDDYIQEVHSLEDTASIDDTDELEPGV